MNLIKSASENFEWGVNLGECARIWKGGCIIRAAFLDDIKNAYVKNKDLDNLLVDPFFTAQILERQAAWRRVVTLCVASGIAAPAMTASLSYFDSYRRARLPANLVQVCPSMPWCLVCYLLVATLDAMAMTMAGHRCSQPIALFKLTSPWYLP